MKGRMVKRTFRLVGIKGKGAFEEFGAIVPGVAREVMSRSGEIGPAAVTEIAIFEPKKSVDQPEGEFCVGLMVEGPARNVPLGMSYCEIEGDYATARGKMEGLNQLHTDLLSWAACNGHQMDTEKRIIEVYCPADSGEEVEIFLPMLVSRANNRSSLYS